MELIMTYDGGVHRVDLDDGDYSVGRSTDSDLQIPVPTVSAHHARVRIEGERLFIRDLRSTNGTDIDGDPITPDSGEVELEAGKTVRFAGVPVWRAEEDNGGQSSEENTSPVALSYSEDGGVLAQTSYHIEEGYSDVARARISKMLSSLFDLVASQDRSANISNKACEFVSRWVDADRVVLLEGSEGTEPEQSGAWSRAGSQEESLIISRTLVDRVIAGQEAILITDVMGASANASESMLALQLRSAMASPLFDNQMVRGILYVDTSRSTVRYSEDELQVLTATANAVAVRMREDRIRQEMDAAARIQLAMIPDELPSVEGYELHAKLVMCREVGGDLYHGLMRPNGNLVLALGDVAGKGAPAALAMSASMVLISALAEIGGEIDEMMDVLHRKLFDSLAPEQFITLFMAELDAATGTLTYASAGHEPPLVVRNDGQIDDMPSTAPPAALVPNIIQKKAEFTLEPGEYFAVFSDGIPEATKDGENFLGLDSVREILSERRIESLETIAEEIFGEVERYLGGHHTSDDITLMLLRRDA